MATDTLSAIVQFQRKQVAEAALGGYLDSALANDITTAKGNGYKPGQHAKNEPAISAPVDGVNR